jgi:hypothetical protein
MSQQTIETKTSLPIGPIPSDEHKQLGVWVGKWNAEGQSYAEGHSNESLQISSVKMTSVETFEWLLDGFFWFTTGMGMSATQSSRGWKSSAMMLRARHTVHAFSTMQAMPRLTK